MDKYIEVFCKQNPKFPLPCGNPDCGEEHDFNSKDVFKNKSFEFQCNRCGKSTSVNSAAIAKDIISKLKKFGITVQ